LKKLTARSRSSCEERLTNAQDERDMRKMDEGPFQGVLPGGTVVLK
jgi:hypothetical protein